MAVDPDASVLTDPAALIDDPRPPQAVREAESDRRRAAARRGRRRCSAPMAPAAFINPAMIQRSAALAAAEPGERLRPLPLPRGLRDRRARRPRSRFATRRPARWPGCRPGSAALLEPGPSVRGRAGRRCARCSRPRASARRRTGSRAGAGGWRSRAHRGRRRPVAVAVDADGHPGYLATARMLGEAGLMLADDGATPDLAGCLTPGPGDRHRRDRPLRARPPAVLGRLAVGQYVSGGCRAARAHGPP